MAPARSNSHFPLITTADTIETHEKTGEYHDVREEPGPKEADRNIRTAWNYAVVSVGA